MIEVEHLTKDYGPHRAIDNISFSVEKGEIMGFLGPNGAGKTTTIRMMMDIIKPDSGVVTVLGEKLSEATKNQLGYLPEEKGLYKKLRVSESIAYLASLKGMDKQSAREKAEELLNQTGMMSNKKKKIEEMSKGMGQIIQFITTIIHNPRLVILDEPFSGLDPVNTELLRDMILDLRNQGKAVILSTHQMNQVEELCDRILMVNNGHAVLYGELSEIKSRYQDNSVNVDYKGEVGEIPGVTERHSHKDYIEMVLDGKTTPDKVLAHLVSLGISINRFEVATPSLHEIFLKEAGKKS